MKKLCLSLMMLIYLTVCASALLVKTVAFNDAPVLDVLEILAKQADIDVVISGDRALIQNKRTTIHFNNIEALTAIEHVLRTNGLNHKVQNGVMLVSLAPVNIFSGEMIAVDLKHLSAARVEELVAKLLPEIRSARAGNQGTIVLWGTRDELNQAQDLIKKIDRPIPQILIESEILEIAEADSVRLGFPHVNQSGVVVVDDLARSLRALITKGEAQVVARPRIVTLDGHEALINIGSRVPYAVPVSNGSTETQWTVEYIDAGVKLRITPRLGDAGYVTTDIKPEVSSISQWRNTSAGDFPVISTRNAQARVRVKSGETIVIGGLLSESDRVNVSRTPIIGQIPILNLLFQDRTVEKAKTEIVFMITPHLI